MRRDNRKHQKVYIKNSIIDSVNLLLKSIFREINVCHRVESDSDVDFSAI